MFRTWVITIKYGFKFGKIEVSFFLKKIVFFKPRSFFEERANLRDQGLGTPPPIRAFWQKIVLAKITFFDLKLSIMLIPKNGLHSVLGAVNQK